MQRRRSGTATPEQIERAKSKKPDPKYKAPLSFSQRVERRFSISPEDYISPKGVVEALGISRSPVWIVQEDGVTHVFEGDYYPEAFFDSKGGFLSEAFPEVKTAADSNRLAASSAAKRPERRKVKRYAVKASSETLRADPETISETVYRIIPLAK